MELSFDLEEWCDGVKEAAEGITQALLPEETNKYSIALARLTNPTKCLCAVVMIKEVINTLRVKESELEATKRILKREREKRALAENS